MIEELGIPVWILVLLIVLIIWETIWKGIGLWKSGRNNQIAWFVCILIFNTAGILPIIYILFFQPKKSNKKKTGRRKK
ncbi:MAG: DUF5652 family protein [Nanoarchaeota archaeon]